MCVYISLTGVNKWLYSLFIFGAFLMILEINILQTVAVFKDTCCFETEV